MPRGESALPKWLHREDCDQCPKEVIACSFQEFGCPAELMRQQMVLHEKHSTQDHLQVVTTVASELKRKVSSLEERLSTLERQVRKPVKVCKIEGYAALKATGGTWSASFMAGDYKLKLAVWPAGVGGDHLTIRVFARKSSTAPDAFERFRDCL